MGVAYMDSRDQWKKIVDRWESKEIQEYLIWIADWFGGYGFQYTPNGDKFLSIILAFAGTIYAKAYSTDNLTFRIYGRLALDLDHRLERLPPEKRKEERKIFYELIETMPKGFKDYSIQGYGILQIPDGKELSVKKANEFLDYLKSKKFDDAMSKMLEYGKGR